jgi:predicted lipoprotein with Yx(FWY)xxD motif
MSPGTTAVCVGALLATALVGGCSGTESVTSGAPSPTSSQAVSALFAVTSATLGPIVIDAQGYVLYRFERDSPSPPRSTCANSCSDRWPPTPCVDDGQIVGIDRQLVGCVRNPDGIRQLTLAGWPAYGFADDQMPGDTNGHGADGQWFAVTPSGGRAGYASG